MGKSTPVVNIENLERALKRLEELPGFECFKKKDGIPELVRENTKSAIEMITGVIDIIKEKATLDFLINGEDDE